MAATNAAIARISPRVILLQQSGLRRSPASNSARMGVGSAYACRGRQAGDAPTWAAAGAPPWAALDHLRARLREEERAARAATYTDAIRANVQTGITAPYCARAAETGF
jgi:hypothetical protein